MKNKREQSRHVNTYGILVASAAGNIEYLKKLVYPGIDLNFLDTHQDRKSSPLHAASRAGHIETVQFLLDYGADINFRRPLDRDRPGEKETPLEAACYAHPDMVRFLLKKGAKIELCDTERLLVTALLAQKGKKEIAQLLVEAGASPKAVNGERGITCLHRLVWAFYDDKTKIIDHYADAFHSLIEMGADLTMPSNRGEDPLSIAKACECQPLVDLYTSAGAKETDHFSSEILNKLSYFKLVKPVDVSLIEFQRFCINLTDNTTIQKLDICTSFQNDIMLTAALEALCAAIQFNNTVRTIKFPEVVEKQINDKTEIGASLRFIKNKTQCLSGSLLTACSQSLFNAAKPIEPPKVMSNLLMCLLP